MREKNYQEERKRQDQYREIYRLRVVEGQYVPSIMKKIGVSRTQVYKSLAIFERDNPQEAAMMKKQGKDVTDEDYKQLLAELSSLKKELAMSVYVRTFMRKWSRSARKCMGLT